MSSTRNDSYTATMLVASPEETERRALVRRVAASRHFAKARQLQDILLYLLDHALNDPSAPIHEQEIACTVLGRKADFDPHEDNIVRVQVSHMRKRLDEYFTDEGASESVRISVPKGGYALRFESRLLPVHPVAVPHQPEPLPESAIPVRQRGHLFPALLVVSVIVLSAAAIWLWLNFAPTRATASPPAATHASDDDPVWPRFFKGQTTNIVVADTSLVTLQDILDTDIQLSGYLDGQYPGSLLDKVPDQSLQKALRMVATRQYTSLADLNSAQRLSELSHRYTSNTPAIRYARHMNVRDFKTGTFIIAGSRRGIPWVRLFEPQLNFVMEEDLRTRSYYFRNKIPQAGEPGAWRQEAKADTTIETYADIALLPNLGNTGYVLILSGIGMEASEAAGEFVASPEFQKALNSILPQSGGHPQLHYFELLLRTRAVAGAARSSQVVANRIIATPNFGS